jgi:hypothetical protein
LSHFKSISFHLIETGSTYTSEREKSRDRVKRNRERYPYSFDDSSGNSATDVGRADRRQQRLQLPYVGICCGEADAQSHQPQRDRERETDRERKRGERLRKKNK